MMIISEKKRDWLAHFSAWIAGVLLALTPFIHSWELIPHMPFRLGNGQFGFNLMICSFLFLLGGTIGGYWWRLCRNAKGEVSSGLLLLVITLLVFAIFASLGFLEKIVYQYGVVALFLGGIAFSYIRRSKMTVNSRMMNRSFFVWLRQSFKANVFFFILFLVAVWTNNVMAVLKLDLSASELISSIIGRFCFSGFLATALFLVTELFMRSMPTKTKWIVWLVIAFLPALIIFDTLQNQIYGRSVIEVLNNLTSNGSINVEKELTAGGFGDISVTEVLSSLVVGYLLTCLLAYGLWVASKNLKRKTSLLKGVILLVVFYVLSVGEQAVGKTWKNLSSWQQEYKSFMLNQGIIKPKLGLADFIVEFKELKFQSSNPELRHKSELPDIYVFMVESMRFDSMDSKTTPFLAEFAKDCQSIKGTWAGSNATHLSWYSLFYSKPAVFWINDLESISNKQNFRGSPILNEMKSMGYSIDVRAVCNLDYKEFGLLNFGSNGLLCNTFEQVEDGNELDQTNIPGREKIVFQRLRESLQNKEQAGGNFFFTAMDSPHYNYYWHEDFEVPYTEFKDDISFPLFPSKEEITLYHNRYRNAVAWVDYQLEEFCEFLKKEGRYDNSIIVITGDHGEEFQEAGGWCHCTSLMPEQTKVPILIKWPATKTDAPAVQLASHLDILPSICSYLGMPDETLQSMNGVDLLSKNENNTVLIATAYANKNGETMQLKRNGYTACFSWSRPWEPRVPSQIRLERITDADGQQLKYKDEDLTKNLRELFPDAFDRYFKSLKQIN